MREIIFRGQTRRYGEKVNMAREKLPSNWVYGGIFPQNNGGDFAVIYQQEPEIEKFTVYADTVGQYTGVKDKNGRKIFEGDIVIVTSINVDEEDGPAVIYWDDFSARFIIWWNGLSSDFECYYGYECEIIGNIYDNPELINPYMEY